MHHCVILHLAHSFAREEGLRLYINEHSVFDASEVRVKGNRLSEICCSEN